MAELFSYSPDQKSLLNIDFDRRDREAKIDFDRGSGAVIDFTFWQGVQTEPSPLANLADPSHLWLWPPRWGPRREIGYRSSKKIQLFRDKHFSTV